ncbi:hypothetical protein Patl1_34413 [Pistacia atlantica]|uniref:Uncharacterized protein n=1 Tax=Pistacia atlantica TaxID=434234 RepID=A0ACC0ZVU0_9ROSI|nr:hypothetical protein Patl1_34413 [Pistacia atlantica]
MYSNNCPSLRKLPLDLVTTTNNRLSIFGRQAWWDEMEWEHLDIKQHLASKFHFLDSPMPLTARNSEKCEAKKDEVADDSDEPLDTYEAEKSMTTFYQLINVEE